MPTSNPRAYDNLKTGLKSKLSLVPGLQLQLEVSLAVLAKYEAATKEMIADDHTYLELHLTGFDEREEAKRALESFGAAIAAVVKTL